MKKYLIKLTDGKIVRVNNGNIVETGLSEPLTKSNFDAEGFDSLNLSGGSTTEKIVKMDLKTNSIYTTKINKSNITKFYHI